MSLCHCSFVAEGYLVTGLMDGRVVAWEAKRAERPPVEILSIDAHKGAVTALSFPKQVSGTIARCIYLQHLLAPLETFFFTKVRRYQVYGLPAVRRFVPARETGVSALPAK